MASNGARKRLVLQALALGVAGGLRSWPAVAMMALTHKVAPATSGWTGWPVFNTAGGRSWLIALAAAEPVADKWPGTIPRVRLKPQLTHIDGGIIGRVAIDTYAAAALGSEYPEKNSIPLAATVGGAAALVSNYAAMAVRDAIVKRTKLPDPTVGSIGDVLCLVILAGVARSRGARILPAKG